MKAVGAQWGIKYKALSILYTGIILAILSYGVYAWFDKVKSKYLKDLASCQRYALLRVTRAYKTVSHNALQVLAGAMPVDLVIKEIRVHYRIRKNMRCSFLEFEFLPGTNKAEAKLRLRNVNIYEWQRRWDTSTKGRVTHDFMPDVRVRSRQIWIKPGYLITQYLTGHGNFGAKLAGFGRADTDECRCGLRQTADHILLECELLRQEHTNFRNELREAGIDWPPEKPRVLDSAIYPILEKHVAMIELARSTNEEDRV